MEKEKQKRLAELTPELRDRIRSWRAQKDKPRAMPQELWDSAIELAQRFGAHAVAKQLEISYTRLKKQTDESRQAIVQTPPPRLIDVSTSFHSASQSFGVEIELQDRLGRRMCIRNADTMVTNSAVSAFWESSR